MDYATALKKASEGTIKAVFDDRDQWLALLHAVGEV
jgi:hypothetical protein